jgi:protein LSM14
MNSLGKRISLISKKNIRYEGILYSINEQNSTLALQNVKSFGTEGRETGSEVFVAPSDDAIAYLVFRGQDIKDLHVHEQQGATDAEGGAEEEGEATDKTPPAPAAPKTKAEKPSPPPPAKQEAKKTAAPVKEMQPKQQPRQQQTTTTTGRGAETTGRGGDNRNGRGSGNAGRGGRAGGRHNNNNNYQQRKRGPAPGTGASLLNRKARGVVEHDEDTDLKSDFDFQANLEHMGSNSSTQDDYPEEEEQPQQAETTPATAYDKETDFFDTISCDAIDKRDGKDNRLKGKQERQMNTETFGAVALDNTHNRYFHRGGRGRGRGRGGRGGGRGRYNNNRDRANQQQQPRVQQPPPKQPQTSQ